jgi:predicted RNA-binding protein with RPS1 domain
VADWVGELGEPAKDFRGRILAPVPRRPARPAVDMSTVQEGAVVEGKVTNLTEFGAFIDFGMGKEGLVHLSEMAAHFVREASEVLEVGQVVKAKILRVDPASKRISLSIRALLPPPPPRPEAERPQGDHTERRRPAEQSHRPRVAEDGPRRGPAPRGARHEGGGRDRERSRDGGGGDRGDRRPPRERDAVRSNAESGGALMNTLLAEQLAALKDKLLSE